MIVNTITLISGKCSQKDCWPNYGMILCNGRPLRVTDHLCNALRTIRAQGYCKLWVEAICINSADKDDIEHHAKLAERIKRRAINTYKVRPPVMDYSSYGSLTAAPTSIRLLRIRRSHLPEDPLVVDVGIFPLAQAPDYTALSYTWGSPDLKGAVFTSRGSMLLVTPNLFGALHHMRQNGYSTVWADAICINQNNNKERSQQILLMGKIYRRAKQVVIKFSVDCTNQKHQKCRAYLQALVKIFVFTSQVLRAVRPAHY